MNKKYGLKNILGDFLGALLFAMVILAACFI